MYLSLRNSLKDDHLNQILDKIHSGEMISKSEGIFLQKFDSIIESDQRDYSHLSKNQVFDKICYLLDSGKNVVCNLYDKDGIINDKIIKIENFFEKDCCVLTLKHGEVAKLFDKFLYKLSYNIKKNEYYLESQDEYFEKIIHNNEN
jgi:hypothetical protein